jgi:hypothetical protein
LFFSRTAGVWLTLAEIVADRWRSGVRQATPVTLPYTYLNACRMT